MTAGAGGEALDVLHVDMDCFFAAVEALDDPRLRAREVIVGGTGPRGVVASCSYEARACGVRSAMPMAEARRRCPGAIVVAGRYERYSEMSSRLHSVLRELTPVIEPIALDEAYLDVSGSHLLFGTSEEMAHRVRRRVAEQLELQCSVGVGRSKLIAKLASREAKPRPSKDGPAEGRGVVVVRACDELSFLHPRPVRDLWGVGPRTAERLARYGIRTVGELAATAPAVVEALVGRAAGRQLHALSWGRDDVAVEPDRAVRSVSHEQTFPTDLREPGALRREVLRLSDSVGGRLRASGLTGRTITVKLRYADFSTITRSHSLDRPVLTSAEITKVASALLDAVDVSAGVRLLGVGVSALQPSAAAPGLQLRLPEVEAGDGSGGSPGSLAQADVEAAVDAIRARYGTGAVGPASVLDTERGLGAQQVGDAPWG